MLTPNLIVFHRYLSLTVVLNSLWCFQLFENPERKCLFPKKFRWEILWSKISSTPAFGKPAFALCIALILAFRWVFFQPWPFLQPWSYPVFTKMMPKMYDDRIHYPVFTKMMPKMNDDRIQFLQRWPCYPGRPDWERALAFAEWGAGQPLPQGDHFFRCASISWIGFVLPSLLPILFLGVCKLWNV